MTEADPIAPSPDAIGVVVLAAGASTRFGRPKQLAKFRGTPLVRHAALAALEVSARVVIVLGSGADEMRGALAGLPLQIVVNESWSEGMGRRFGRGCDRCWTAVPFAPSS
jgi:molybdenum cofactor cytidylyltransferase